jgi:agmatinase
MRIVDSLGQIAGSTSFMKTPYITSFDELKKYQPDVAILGIPLDDGQSWKTGTRFAPRAIRNASTYFSTKKYHLQLNFDYFENIEVVDFGDTKIFPGYIEKSQIEISNKISQILDHGVIPVIIGGDHSITHPIIKAYKKNNTKLGIIQVDAHLDLRPGALEGRISNGTPMRGIIDEKLIEPKNLVQLGIRDFIHKADWDFAKKNQVKTYTMPYIEENGLTSILKEALSYAWDGVDEVYLTFDIDSIDPSIAPGTGSPTFGGFSSNQVLEIIRTVGKNGLAGFDLVEVLPMYDLHDLTSTLSSRIIVELLASLVFKKMGIKY